MARERLSGGMALLAALTLVGALSARVNAPLPIALAAPPALPGTPDDQLTVAADEIERAWKSIERVLRGGGRDRGK